MKITRKNRKFEHKLDDLREHVDRHCRIGLQELMLNQEIDISDFRGERAAIRPNVNHDLEALSQIGLTAPPAAPQADTAGELFRRAVALVAKIIRDAGGDPTSGTTSGAEPKPGDSAHEPGQYPTV
jgi:hypothetical protein